MTRIEALEIARKAYAAYQSAYTNHLFRDAPAPVDADYGYHHGWVSAGEFNFGSDEMVGPTNQPYMD